MSYPKSSRNIAIGQICHNVINKDTKEYERTLNEQEVNSNLSIYVFRFVVWLTIAVQYEGEAINERTKEQYESPGWSSNFSFSYRMKKIVVFYRPKQVLKQNKNQII